MENPGFTLRTPEKLFVLGSSDNKELQQWITVIQDTIDNFNKKQIIRNTSFTFNDGAFYTGEWVDGTMTGKGTLMLPNGNSYVGEFKGSQLEGQGVFKFVNGDIFQGSFKDSKFHGQGTLTTAHQCYVGNWANGNRHGGMEYIV